MLLGTVVSAKVNSTVRVQRPKPNSLLELSGAQIWKFKGNYSDSHMQGGLKKGEP